MNFYALERPLHIGGVLIIESAISGVPLIEIQKLHHSND